MNKYNQRGKKILQIPAGQWTDTVTKQKTVQGYDTPKKKRINPSNHVEKKGGLDKEPRYPHPPIHSKKDPLNTLINSPSPLLPATSPTF